MKNRFVLPVLLILAACSSSHKEAVGTVAPDRAIGKWQVVTTAAKGHDTGLCYAFSAPVGAQGTYTGKRGKAYLMATRRKSGKIEVSVSSGYPYKHGSEVDLVTAKTTFPMKAKDSIAWAKNDKQDKAILAALKKPGSVAVSGITYSGGVTLDAYSTEGFASALERVKALCP